jgi:hypothetical protein
MGARALAARHGLRVRAHGIAPFEARGPRPLGPWLGPRVACVGPVDRNENGYDFTMNR